jgi:ubiquinone/menaquinone biosynthesis C-methylase UbiE
MGRVFDIKSAELYEAWQKSQEGIFIDRSSNELIVRLLNPQKGERVLDVGCGAGNHLLLFYRLGLDTTGIDASPYMLDVARPRLGDKASLYIGRAEDLPFEDNEFDLVTIINTLEFLDDPLTALREAGRVARDRVFLGVFNGFSFGCICEKLSAIFGKSIFGSMHLLTLWGIKNYVRRAYGNVDIEWESAQLTPLFFRKYAAGADPLSSLRPNPFGYFLGMTVKMIYTLKPEELKATERLRKGRETLIGSPGF